MIYHDQLWIIACLIVNLSFIRLEIGNYVRNANLKQTVISTCEKTLHINRKNMCTYNKCVHLSQK